jgi:L-threonylcarbamoyladenylate synthase
VKPRILRVGSQSIAPDLLGEVVSHLRRGGLVAMPTETVYGFGGTLTEKPLTELQRLKGRGGEKPFLILVPDESSVSELDWNPPARELAQVFWPGALTLVLRDDHGRFPTGVRSPEGTVAVRQTPHPVARRLVEAVGEPLVSTSANPAGGRPALSGSEALAAATSVRAGSGLWILDAGTLEPSEPSTIVDCTGSRPTVLRVGSIPVDRLRCVLPDLQGPH